MTGLKMQKAGMDRRGRSDVDMPLEIRLSINKDPNPKNHFPEPDQVRLHSIKSLSAKLSCPSKYLFCVFQRRGAWCRFDDNSQTTKDSSYD